MVPFKNDLFFYFLLKRLFKIFRNSKNNEWHETASLSHKKGSFGNHLYTLCSLLSIILLTITSCRSEKKENSSFNLSSEERVWMTQFFNDLMLEETAIYTLWGSSKPMTLIAIEQYSDEKKQAFYNSLTEEEKEECVICEGSSLDKTWPQWEKIQNRFPMKRYMLFKADLLQEEKVLFILFVDVLKTAAIIQDNYEAFKKAIGFDFHPLELTLNMKQKNSVLLEKLSGNAHLWGILFGFGKMNSYLFQWQHFDHPQSCNEFCENIVSFSSNKPFRGRIKFTIDQFWIPGFKTFNEIDPVVENFEKEREKIKEIYKRKDFLDLTLKKLTE
jgi:hypothetical protein